MICLWLVLFFRYIFGIAYPGYFKEFVNSYQSHLEKELPQKTILFEGVFYSNNFDETVRNQLVNILEKMRSSNIKFSALEYIEIEIYKNSDWNEHLNFNIEAIYNLILNCKDLEFDINLDFAFKRKILEIEESFGQDVFKFFIPEINKINNLLLNYTGETKIYDVSKIYIFNGLYDDKDTMNHYILKNRLLDFIKSFIIMENNSPRYLVLYMDAFEKSCTEIFLLIRENLTNQSELIKLAINISLYNHKININEYFLNISEIKYPILLEHNFVNQIYPQFRNIEEDSIFVIFFNKIYLQDQTVNELLQIETKFIDIKFCLKYNENPFSFLSFCVIIEYYLLEKIIKNNKIVILFHIVRNPFQEGQKCSQFIFLKKYEGIYQNQKIFQYRYQADFTQKNYLVPPVIYSSGQNINSNNKKVLDTINFIKFILKNYDDIFFKLGNKKIISIENNLCHWRKKTYIKYISNKTKENIYKQIFLSNGKNTHNFNKIESFNDNPDEINVDVYMFSQSVSQFHCKNPNPIKEDLHNEYRGHYLYKQQIRFINQIEKIECENVNKFLLEKNILIILRLSKNAKYHIFINKADTQETLSRASFDEKAIIAKLKILISIFFSHTLNKNEEEIKKITENILGRYFDILKSRLFDFEFLEYFVDSFLKNDFDSINICEMFSVCKIFSENQLNQNCFKNKIIKYCKEEIIKCLIDSMQNSVLKPKFKIFVLANIYAKQNEAEKIFKCLCGLK